ncbi:MAG: hypothetical protein IJS40_05240 [Synergistaceae bacterium]|nr:hypothetical protein [Synergistaceae bacterium]
MKKILIALMIVLALCSVSSAADNDDVSRKIEALEKQVEYLRQSVSDLSTQLNKADMNNIKNYSSLYNRIESWHDFVIFLTMAINILFIGLPVLLICLTWCQENRSAKKLLDVVRKKLEEK